MTRVRPKLYISLVSLRRLSTIDNTITSKMKVLTATLAVITVLLHHFLPIVTPADHTIVPNTRSTGFSIPLVTSYEGLDHTIHRGSDGFLHLQHKLRTTEPSSEMITPINMPHSLSIRMGDNPYQYILKVDTSSSLTWLQCEPCEPKASQYNDIFNPAQSHSYTNVTGANPYCRPPYTPVFSGRDCNFRIAGPRGMLVEGFLGQEEVSIVGSTAKHPDFLIGCSHSTRNFASEGRYAGVAAISTAPTSFVMQMAARGVTRFSYCLSGGSKANRQGFFHFGTDIPRNPHYKTTRIMPAPDSHEFHVSLVGISLGAHKLDKIHPEMFARSKDGQDLQSHGAERVKRPGFNLCFRATEVIMGHLPSLSLHFSEEEAVMVLSPKQLFLMMDDKEGQIACLAMTPGHRTIIGSLQQVDMRFVYDLKDFTLFFVSESCTKDTVEIE
ncbi:hypothetical protein EJB05_10764, partial [Eragrostis curvula]